MLIEKLAIFSEYRFKKRSSWIRRTLFSEKRSVLNEFLSLLSYECSRSMVSSMWLEIAFAEMRTIWLIELQINENEHNSNRHMIMFCFPTKAFSIDNTTEQLMSIRFWIFSDIFLTNSVGKRWQQIDAHVIDFDIWLNNRQT